MNIYTNLKQEAQTNEWLRENGINVKSFTKTKPQTLKAQQSATQLLNEYADKLDNSSKRLLRYFQRCYNDKNQRDKITSGDCYRVFNIAGRVKRGEYRDSRKMRRQTA